MPCVGSIAYNWLSQLACCGVRKISRIGSLKAPTVTAVTWQLAIGIASLFGPSLDTAIVSRQLQTNKQKFLLEIASVIPNVMQIIQSIRPQSSNFSPELQNFSA